MKKTSIQLLIAVAALVVVIVVAAIAAPFFIPVSVFKDQIETRAKDATGRTLAIKGGMSLALFPTVAIEAPEATADGPSPAGVAPARRTEAGYAAVLARAVADDLDVALPRRAVHRLRPLRAPPRTLAARRARSDDGVRAHVPRTPARRAELEAQARDGKAARH